MTDTTAEAETVDLVLEYELDAPPEKVWRAITVPELREAWLPGRDLADTDPLFTVPGNEIRFRMRDDTPPYLESIVAFQIEPGQNSGTILRITQGLVDARLTSPMPKAANSNEPALMLAA